MVERGCPGKAAHREGAWSQKRGEQRELWRLHVTRFGGSMADPCVSCPCRALLSSPGSPTTQELKLSRDYFPLLLAIAAADYQHLHDLCGCHGRAANPTAPAAPADGAEAGHREQSPMPQMLHACCKDLVQHISISRALRGAARKTCTCKG